MSAAAIVFAAAPLRPTPRLKRRLLTLEKPFVVAADNGATTALRFGLRPDVIVGDLDSLEARLPGVPVEEHPRDKDATDGQLAIRRALAEHPAKLFLVGFLGGPRLDQAVANILLLIDLETPAVLLDERNECTLLHPGTERAWSPEPDEVISLIPIGGDVHGVTTRGLRWPLRNEALLFGDTRGLSNEPAASEVGVATKQGLLLLTRHFVTV